jgi:hypothetical protein
MDVTNEERILGKSLPNQKTFDATEDFKAITEARKFLDEQGFSVAHMQAGAPMGIKKGVWDIQKWRNLSDSDKKLMDGVILGNFRNGPITVIYA